MRVLSSIYRPPAAGNRLICILLLILCRLTIVNGNALISNRFSLRGSSSSSSTNTTIYTYQPLDPSTAQIINCFGVRDENVLPVRRNHDPINHVRIDSPTACAVTSSGDIYFTEVQRLSRTNFKSGAVESVSVTLNLKLGMRIKGLWISSDDEVYLVDESLHRIVKVSADAQNYTIISDSEGFKQANARLQDPSGICGDNNAGHLFVVDTSHHVLWQVDLQTGKVIQLAGSGKRGFENDGGNALNASMNFPSSCVADEQTGDVYIADTANLRIRKYVRHNSTLVTVAGDGGAFESHRNTDTALSASIGSVYSLWKDPWGNIFFATQFAMTMMQPHYDFESKKYHQREIVISSPFQDKTRILMMKSPHEPLLLVAGGGSKLINASSLTVSPVRATTVSIHSARAMCGDRYGSVYFPLEYGIQRIVRISNPVNDWVYNRSSISVPTYGKTTTTTTTKSTSLRGVGNIFLQPSALPPQPALRNNSATLYLRVEQEKRKAGNASISDNPSSNFSLRTQEANSIDRSIGDNPSSSSSNKSGFAGTPLAILMIGIVIGVCLSGLVLVIYNYKLTNARIHRD